MSLERRLRALEAMPRRSELPTAPEGWHVVGAGMLVPLPLEPGAWERLARDSQAELRDLERRLADGLA